MCVYFYKYLYKYLYIIVRCRIGNSWPKKAKTPKASIPPNPRNTRQEKPTATNTHPQDSTIKQ